MKFIRKLFKTIIYSGWLICVVLILIWTIFKAVYSDKIITIEDPTSSYKVALVFGAGLHWDGSPTPVLRDRVKTAVELYNDGKVEKLLFSGDNRFEDYNEPGAMFDYAIELGVPAEDIILDYAGRRTYDTCYRAKEIFKVDKAMMVTQRFHLPRAIFLCEQLGIQSIGVEADLREYSKTAQRYWNFREIFATISAIWDVWIEHPLPVLGEELPIF